MTQPTDPDSTSENPPVPEDGRNPEPSASNPPGMGEATPSAAPKPDAPQRSFPSPFGSAAAAATLSGELAPLARPTLIGLADALLKSPANVVFELNHNSASVRRFALLVAGLLMMTGVVVASFSGGYQLVAVPLKLALGAAFGAALCLPSLYIFVCLSGGRVSLGNVAVALLMGLGVQALLLTGFAPIAWVFSQSTQSSAFMAGLYILMFFVSTAFGLGITARVLTSEGPRVGGLLVWKVMFVVVLLQLMTNLRPLVGEFQGVGLLPKQFFLQHWLEVLGA